MVPSAAYCTQGPQGAFSHAKHGSRAVDLGWGGMSSNPGFVAPSNGRIISSRAQSTCSDGTNYGGIVVFEDENGYRWTFIHVRPVATGAVSQGDVIGEVQFSPEAQVGKCWTGAHLHVQIQNSSGKYVNAEEFLNDVGCGFTCP